MGFKTMGFKRPVLSLLACCCCLSALAEEGTSADSKKSSAVKVTKVTKHPLDHSGQPRKGKASFYAHSFAGKKMADGTPMNPEANIAASKTLPLGTTARVTNLENGKSEIVEIRDRGPYVDGRIVDLSPKVADKLEIRKQGVAPVEVAPIKVPQPDGSTKLGAAADTTMLSSGN